MKRTTLSGESTRRNRTPERTREGNGRTSAAPACGGPPFHCPHCGTAVASATDAVKKQQRFLKRLLDRQDQLQQSFAFWLHEDLAQQLRGALLYFEAAEQLQERPVGDAENNFQIGLKLVRGSIQAARRIAGQLQPLICSGGGVELGIEHLIHEMRNCDGPEIVFQVEGEVDRLAPELGIAVLRILQELVTNACRHSGSEELRVGVARTQDRLEIEVEDWGIGFDWEKVNGHAFGLQEVYHRATLLDGEMVVDSAPGKGTRISVSFPFQDMPLADA
ncbi:MAG: sensor histidine kinase [Thermoguttaceae bacterium]